MCIQTYHIKIYHVHPILLVLDSLLFLGSLVQVVLFLEILFLVAFLCLQSCQVLFHPIRLFLVVGLVDYTLVGLVVAADVVVAPSYHHVHASYCLVESCYLQTAAAAADQSFLSDYSFAAFAVDQVVDLD